MKVFLWLTDFLFLSKMLGNKICQTWSKQLENEGMLTLYRGFPLFWSMSTFISDIYNVIFLQYSYRKSLTNNVINVFSVWYGILFIRQGLYQEGVFRFKVTIPDNFPDGDCPVSTQLQLNLERLNIKMALW